MIRKRRITDEAKADMREIRAYTIAQWGTAQADVYLRNIGQKIEFLTGNPQIGINRSEEFGYEVYSCFIGSHAIYYWYDEKILVIRAILHQSQLPDNHLRERRN